MENIDFLSPPITLFYLKRRTHTSKIGGLLVIFLVTLIFTYISYTFIDESSNKNVNSVFYKKYENEAGYFSFNTSSLFHFFLFLNSANKNFIDKYDNKNIRIYTIPSLNCDKESDLISNDHWVFDSCNEENIKNLNKNMFINIKNFTNGACIKYYYNSTKKEYFSIDNPNFIWPNLEHGVSNNDNKFVNTIVTKCSNSSISVKVLGYCNSENEINNYLIEHQAIYLYFIDNLIDVTNYRNPLQSYFYPINSNIGKGITFVDNYIHYSPVRLSTNEGLIFNNKINLNSISFDQNRKGEAKNSENGVSILVKYHHLLQNNVLIYERSYNNLFDIFSQIGGVVQMLFYIFYGVNYLYNTYIILYDTNHIFFLIEKGGSRKNINVNEFKKILFCNEKDINYSNVNNVNNINNIKTIIGNKTTIIKNNNMNQKAISSNELRGKTINNFALQNKNKSLFGNLNSKKENDDDVRIYNNYYSNLDDSKKNGNLNDNSISKILKVINKNSSNNDSDQFQIMNIFNSSKRQVEDKNINNNVDKDINKQVSQNKSIFFFKNETLSQSMVLGKKFSLFYCVKMICNKRINNNMILLFNFRKKLLSEEYLFKSYLTSILFEKHGKINSGKNISFPNSNN